MALAKAIILAVILVWLVGLLPPEGKHLPRAPLSLHGQIG